MWLYSPKHSFQRLKITYLKTQQQKQYKCWFTLWCLCFVCDCVTLAHESSCVHLSTPEVLGWPEWKEFSRPVWKHTHSCRGWINPAGCSQMSSFHADSRSCCCRSSSPDLLSSPNWENDTGLRGCLFPHEGIITRRSGDVYFWPGVCGEEEEVLQL